MKFSEVMIYYDYKMTEIMRALNVAHNTVRMWKERDKIPYARQCEIEILTQGKLKAKREDA